MKQLDPTANAVAIWLRTLTRSQLHDQGWIQANKRFHGITRAARPFIQANFPDDADQQAAFDGMTLALLALAHFEDIEQLGALFETKDK
ncbi:MAG TPA: hypothetical protein VLF91_00145 [Candidatus Saccharimonadales bacterium]|nr:hypothetical protein [Candidatus Saccharimonadales bacterium]